MTRTQVKRLLALLRAEAELGRKFPELDNLPENFKKSFEEQEAFRGWVNYHVTWDVADEDVWLTVKLKVSKVAAWNQQLRKRVPIITKEGEIVTPKQFEEMEKAGVVTLAELEESKLKGS